MKGLIMDYPLITNTILEYGKTVYPEKKIITYLPDGTRQEQSFEETYNRTKKLASALQNKLGIKKGDFVGTFAWNNSAHVELYYGISGIGAINHTINIRLSPKQIAYIINHANDKVIFVDATLVPLLEKIQSELKNVKHFVILYAPENFETTLPNTLYYEELIVDEPEDFDWPEIDENDACGMCYTSGTTGDPKGVLYSHRSTYLHALTIGMPNAGNYNHNDTLLLIVPQFHVMAWGFPYMSMLVGANMVMPTSNLKPKQIINILQKEKVTKANGVPTIWLGVYQEMKKNPLKEKLTLQEILVGGSTFPKSLIEGFEKDFNIKGIQAWGMTETSPLGTASRLQKKHLALPEEEQMKIRAKQGIPMFGVEIRIVDAETGEILPHDGKSMGELQIKGAWVISSYFKGENSDKFTEDGWFKTGDICTIDEDSYMEIKDRTKDLIKSGGEWISSVDLETALMSHPKIKEAAVIAIPDEKWMERPLATLIRANNEEKLSEEELKDFLLKKKFRKYQIPDEYIYLSEIPKTSVGKFNKKEMRKLYAENRLK